MVEDKLKAKIAELESINDQMETEIVYLDKLMREIGFTDGLESVRETAKSMSSEEDQEE